MESKNTYIAISGTFSLVMLQKSVKNTRFSGPKNQCRGRLIGKNKFQIPVTPFSRYAQKDGDRDWGNRGSLAGGRTKTGAGVAEAKTGAGLGAANF